MLLALLVATLVSFGIWSWQNQRASVLTSSDSPVIIISIDTLRADRMALYGGPAPTPHLDRLARDGLLFERAYSHSPQTLPAHTSILSGELPFEHGVRDNVGFSAKPDQRFLQHALLENGFATAAFVSAYVLRKSTGLAAGFQVYDDDMPPGAPDKPLGLVQRAGEETVRRAAAWIDMQRSSKFFLFVHIYEPHTPYSPPARFAAAHPYDGEVQHADEIIGTLLEHLRERDLYERAAIIVVSDHGEGLGDHGEDEHGIFLYQETIQVPLIVKLPGRSGGARKIAAPVQHIDLAATILDMVGLAPGTSLRGRPLRPLFENSGALAEASIYSEALSPRYHFGWSELYALTDQRYRLIRAPHDELYDILHDPQEQTSIASERPQVRTAMRRALEQMIAGRSISAPGVVSAADREKLAALGYVGTQAGGSLALPGDTLPDPKDKIDVLQKYWRATATASSGRMEDAARILREVLREDPAMTSAWLQLAAIYGRRGQTADAVAAFKEAVARSPRDPAAVTGAASSLLQLGRLDEARAHAELAVAVAPATAHELLGRIALRRGEVESARRHARAAIAADPSLPMPDFVEGLIHYEAGRYADAVPYLSRAVEALARRTEQVPDVRYLLGDSLARLERHQEAERLFQAELAVFPSHVRARMGLAMLYQATGRTAEAEATIDEMLRISPTPEAYDTAARLWTMFGRPDRASAIRARSRAGPR